ncbi:DUF3662 domain-containing protein [Streptomyces sp. NBC_01465]|uniref:DUF3662 domain-containing protein n=1 Tax=Streptomyces sp. NBC_01465 TaxID=2903878 RepID=UPI002E37A286|nr:DUF3662 domain-containing protein [Streptomyces sp. NBC_01465]
MKMLTTLECAMERWTDALWALMMPPVRKQAEVADALRRQCDDRALILDRRRTVVPNAFVVELPAETHSQLGPSESQVVIQLARGVRRYAAEQGYTFAGPVAVRLAAAHGADVGRFRVRSRIAPAQGEPRVRAVSG